MKSVLTCSLVTGLEELGELREFLKKNKLPADDVRLDGSLYLLYRDPSGQIAGSGGLEFYGSYCLLRSVAIAEEFRNQGHGVTIATDLIKRASEQRLIGIYLLTETAEKFFGKLGFGTVPREKAPAEIMASSEFSSVCPVSAALMTIGIEKS